MTEQCYGGYPKMHGSIHVGLTDRDPNPKCLESEKKETLGPTHSENGLSFPSFEMGGVPS